LQKENPGTSIKDPAKHQHPDHHCPRCWRRGTEDENKRMIRDGQWSKKIDIALTPTRIPRIAEKQLVGRLAAPPSGTACPATGAWHQDALAPIVRIMSPCPVHQPRPRHLRKASHHPSARPGNRRAQPHHAPTFEHLVRNHAFDSCAKTKRKTGDSQQVSPQTYARWRPSLSSWRTKNAKCPQNNAAGTRAFYGFHATGLQRALRRAAPSLPKKGFANR